MAMFAAVPVNCAPPAIADNSSPAVSHCTSTDFGEVPSNGLEPVTISSCETPASLVCPAVREVPGFPLVPQVHAVPPVLAALAVHPLPAVLAAPSVRLPLRRPLAPAVQLDRAAQQDQQVLAVPLNQSVPVVRLVPSALALRCLPGRLAVLAVQCRP